MTTPKPTIVLVPGAWHTPAAYDPILPFLHAAGYPTTSVHHPSVGVSPGLPDFSADVAAVRATVGGLSDLGRDIVLVSHSYGAIPASEAVRGLGKSERKANGLPGGVIKLFYIAAIVPKKGGSLVDCLTESADPSMEDGRPALGRVDNGVRKKISPITDLKYGIPHADTISQDGTDSITNGPEIFYHDVSPAEQKYHVSLLRTQSLGPLKSPLTYDAYNHIPSMYLFCVDDRALFFNTQRNIVREAGITETRSIDTSHSPFLSQPEAVVDFIKEAATNSQYA